MGMTSTHSLLSMVTRHSVPMSRESGNKMTEEIDDLQDKLAALDIALEGAFTDAIDFNADLIAATKTMAHRLLIIRNGHLAQADRLMDMVKNLAECAHITAQLNADVVGAEWNIEEILDDLEDEDDEEDE